MTFRTACQVFAAFTFVLFGVLLVAPPVVFWMFGIDGGPVAALLTRRAAVLVLGVALTLWLAREAAPSPARQAIAFGVGVSWLGLAVLGAVEFFRGMAGAGIWVAIVTELALGGSFLRAWAADRDAAASLTEASA